MLPPAITLHPSAVSTSVPALGANSTHDALSVLENVGSSTEPVCQSTLGTNLDLLSCYSAASSFAALSTYKTYAIRGRRFDVQIPRRTSSLDGTCVIDILLKDGAVFDEENGTQIKDAVKSILDTCVSGRGGRISTGGYVGNLGKLHNLFVTISSYKPAVRCYGSIGSATTANQDLIDQIPTTFKTERFGYGRAPRADVLLPRTFRQRFKQDPQTRRGFYVSVFADNKHISVDTRWVDVWAAVVSINTMCVRDRSSAGKVTLRGGLQVKLDRSYRPPPDVGSSEPEGNSTDSVATA